MSLDLSLLVAALERIAPLALAQPWDNVGLLIDPRAPGAALSVETVVCAIDATPSVIDEAARVGARCLVAYHPPLFQPIKRLSAAAAPLAFHALARGLAVYSPHTALDAARDGLDDWLAAGFGEGEVTALQPSPRVDPGAELKLVVFVPEEAADALRSALAAVGAGVIGNYTECSFGLRGEGTFFGGEGAAPVVGNAGRLERAPELRLEMVCPKRALARVARAIAEHHPYEEPAWDVYPLAPKLDARAGSGRRVRLAEPRPLDALVSAVKRHLGLSHVRVAATAAHATGAPIATVAVGAGAGSSTFEGVRGVDLFVTGELGHHHVLAKLREGASVILAEHSSSERGYLPRLKERLIEATEGRVQVVIAESDVEPLQVA